MDHGNFSFRRWISVIGILLAVSTLKMCVAADEVATASAPATPTAPAWPNLKEVVVVFKTHFDIGYTDLARNVVQKYRTTMIDKALDVCDATRHSPANQQFVWTLSGWPLAQILYPEQTAERRDRVKAAMRDGRFVWHALAATTHTESLELEDIVRGMRFSSDLSRLMDMPLPRDAKMTDVPSHCWALPTILAHAGVEFVHIGCNGASTPPETPTLFWWEGPDGSRVMTMLVLGYGTGLTPPKDWPYQTWLALIHTGDNHGPPSPAEVGKLIEQAAKSLPGVQVRMGRLSDFADAIRAEEAVLPVVRADMPDTWIHGIMSKPVDTGLARRVRPRIGQLEVLNSQLGCWGVDVPEVKDTVARAYEQSLLFGEHTWGMDVKKFPRLYGKAWEDALAKGKYAKLEESWGEHSHYIRAAAELVEPSLAEEMKALARSVQVEGPRIVVYNPLPWSRSEAVAMRLPSGVSAGVRDVGAGREVVSESADGEIRFVASDVPSCGYKTFALSGDVARLEPMVAGGKTGTLDNGLLRIKLDPARGGIVSILDKRTGRELVAPTGEALGSYCYQQFDADDAERFLGQYNTHAKRPWVDGDFGKPGLRAVSRVPRRSDGNFGKPGLPAASQMARYTASASGMSMRMESGPVIARAVLSAAASKDVPHAIELAITLYRGLSYVDVAWTVKDKKPTPWPEAGWLCLPLAIDSPSFRLGRLGAIVDPARDLQTGSNTQVFCLNTGMTMTDAEGIGIGICPLDSPLVCLGQPNLWQYKRKFEAPRSAVYVNLFNNQWSTNFDQWCGGTWTSRVRIWLTRGTDSLASLSTPSLEARNPVLADFSAEKGGSLKSVAAGVALSRPGVVLTSFGSNSDGEGTLLRVWDQAGQSGPCRITLPAGAKFTHARSCDLRGRWKGEAVPIQHGNIEATVPPFGPASFILSTAE